ncbi:MAG: 50S ribosomal protein L11 methyltransferase [Ardenticatenaceae bacterium]|nr:50S ribosomal protein L11 methyltransferase [Anaerolineales bacterium]MCB8919585.1 50S ribosomal protein L11 methyltransferase [Ardenticatenaceae bacterium]
MYWLEVSVRTDGEAAEAVAEALQPLAHGNGVVLEQLGDPHDLDPLALEPEVTVKIYLPEDQDTPAVRRRIEEIIYHLGRLYPIPAPTFRELADEDWANAWKAHYHPFRVGQRLWIQPSWLALEAERAADVILTLDPGMAFGTGLHPTTQMCLQAIEQLTRPGSTMLDVGTGTGILAIAAAKLGASAVLGVDNDRLAVAAASENAAKNDVASQITIREGTLAEVPLAPYDLVVVNILAPVIVGLLREGGLLGYVAPAGQLVLSGIIDEQAPQVIAALTAAGGSVHEMLTVRDWVAIIAHPAGT